MNEDRFFVIVQRAMQGSLILMAPQLRDSNVSEENNRFDKYDEPADDRARGSMRRRSIANSRTRSRKRGGGATPTKFNGIHRRRSKRTSW